MVQDIITFMFIAASATYAGRGFYRIFRPSGRQAGRCNGCSGCQAGEKSRLRTTAPASFVLRKIS